jgi:tRNA-Thr(GGU) m(6)t(6)A37 methyltransferase TsaA
LKQISYRPIGVIHSPYKDIEGMPIQTSGAEGVAGTVEVEPEFMAGLRDIESFSHLILIYHFHLSQGYTLEVKPFLDTELRGVFATRAPKRPNPIGISVVRLAGVEGSVLDIRDVDVVDGTPLLDLKPYVPEFDARSAEKIGWLSKVASNARQVRADRRFQ